MIVFLRLRFAGRCLRHCNACLLTALRYVSVYIPYFYHLDSKNITQGKKKGNLLFGSLLTYEKVYKALNVPDKPHSEFAVIFVAADTAIT